MKMNKISLQVSRVARMQDCESSISNMKTTLEIRRVEKMQTTIRERWICEGDSE